MKLIMVKSSLKISLLIFKISLPFTISGPSWIVQMAYIVDRTAVQSLTDERICSLELALFASRHHDADRVFEHVLCYAP